MLIDRGHKSPILVPITMITIEQIKNIIENKIIEDNCFIVDIKVTASNKITVLIDSFDGVNIDYCIKINRLIEGALDREVEDFELEVSTPGLGKPLKVIEQYKKNIGRNIEIIPLQASPIKAKLIDVNEERFEAEEEKKVKIEGKKKKELQVIKHKFLFEEVKSVKVIIAF